MGVDLVISIVSFNTRQPLLDCLRSIADHPPSCSFEVVVADNASRDGSADAVRCQFPDVVVLNTGANLGYGRANNAALLGRDARYYLILNSDIVMQPDALDLLVAHMDRHPEHGAVGGALLNTDSTMQRNWAVGEINLGNIACEQLFLSKIFPRSRIAADFLRPWWDRNHDAIVPQACGACLLVRGPLYNALGGFDPSIFMYAEDSDLCRRIRDRGLLVAYVASARFTHLHGQSSVGALRPRMIAEYNRSRIYYVAKHTRSRAAAIAARRWMVVGALLRAAVWAVIAVSGTHRDALPAQRAAGFVRVAVATAWFPVGHPKLKN